MIHAIFASCREVELWKCNLVRGVWGWDYTELLQCSSKSESVAYWQKPCYYSCINGCIIINQSKCRITCVPKERGAGERFIPPLLIATCTYWTVIDSEVISKKNWSPDVLLSQSSFNGCTYRLACKLWMSVSIFTAIDHIKNRQQESGLKSANHQWAYSAVVIDCNDWNHWRLHNYV